MGRLIQFKGASSPVLVFHLDDFTSILREYVGDEAVDYLDNEIDSFRFKNELDDLEKRLCEAEILLSDACSYIVSGTKTEKQDTLPKIVKKIREHKRKEDDAL